jgi:transposase-like protein
MDVSRAVYGRDLRIAAMRALDAGATNGEIARKYQVSPHLLDRWREEWRAKGELAFPGLGRRGVASPAVDDARRIAPSVHSSGASLLRVSDRPNFRRLGRSD